MSFPITTYEDAELSKISISTVIAPPEVFASSNPINILLLPEALGVVYRSCLAVPIAENIAF